MHHLTRVLCICTYGHSRSVALTRVLHAKGIPAVAVGYATAGAEALEVLAGWANVIAILTDEARHGVPAKFGHKITEHFIVGPDRWSNPYHPELLSLLEQRAAAMPGLMNPPLT